MERIQSVISLKSSGASSKHFPIERAAFTNKLFYTGISKGSITDRFLEQVNGNNNYEFESQLAIDALAIYDQDEDGVFESDFSSKPEAMIKKNQSIITNGSITEMVFSFGGNLNEKLLLGATLGIPFLRYEETKNYNEVKSDDNNIDFFNELKFKETLNTSGTGINIKLGAIYKISKMFRLGAAYQSRTKFSLEDNYKNTLLYDYTDANGQVVAEKESPDGFFNYKLRTPAR